MKVTFWILFSKSSEGLKPNVDFVSGYPGGFEALIFLLSRLFNLIFFSVQIVQVVVLALLFCISVLGIKSLFIKNICGWCCGLVAYAGYGA